MLKRVVIIRRISFSRWGTQSVISQSISLRKRVYNPNTRTYVRLLGPCFKTGRITTPKKNVKTSKRKQQEQKIKHVTFCEHTRKSAHNRQWETTVKPPQDHCVRTPQLGWKRHLNNDQVHVKGYAIRFHLTISRTFHILFKFLFIFPSRYLFAIGLRVIFSFRRTLPPN